jgi:hypothetical protein
VRLPHWSFAPDHATTLQRKNFRHVQVDAIGIGLYSAAVPFLPVLLTRLGATSFQVALLTTLPALIGFLLAILIGRFLQRRRNIVPWFSRARLLVVLSYGVMGLVPFVVPRGQQVPAILLIRAVATLPEIIVGVAFSVVMNAVAGPKGRYDLMSRRWTVLGLTTATTATVAGQVLNRLPFPINYQLVFMALSLGGFVSYYYSTQIEIPDAEPPPRATGVPIKKRLLAFLGRIRGEREFTSFATKRFVFLSGAALSAPLFPLYYVRVVQASDAWIGIFSTAQTASLLIGYSLWSYQSRARGSRFALLWTAFGVALYPALVAATRRVELIALSAVWAGIFQAGLDLVFFDELMKRVPADQSATFVAVAQSMQHFSIMISPLVGTWLGDHIGIGWALLASTALRLTGWALFAYSPTKRLPG